MLAPHCVNVLNALYANRDTRGLQAELTEEVLTVPPAPRDHRGAEQRQNAPLAGLALALPAQPTGPWPLGGCEGPGLLLGFEVYHILKSKEMPEQG